jgi:hypothetical protein
MASKIKKLMKYHSPLVLSIHGIRTRGEWQKIFASVVGGSRTKNDSFDFGRYGLLRFLTPPFNDRLVDNFYEWISTVLASNRDIIDLERYDKKPSIIAHSLGSWVLGYAMLKHEDLCFDKIILAGSILPQHFDWELLFSRNQVSRVRNECGKLDPWPGLAKRLVKGAGTGGVEGFDCFAPALENIYFQRFAHSDALLRRHIETHWMPFLNSPPSPLTLVHGREIDEEKRFLGILAHTGDVIDEEAFAILPHYKAAEIPEGLAEKWIAINPDIYTFLIDSRNQVPVGYINAMPVEDGIYAKIRGGELLDNAVPAQGIRPFQSNTAVKVYLMSMAISKSERHWGQGVLQSAYLQLLKGFLDKLIWYSKNERIRVTHFVAAAWTEDGRRMCEQFAMHPVGSDKFGDTIYELELASIDLSSNIKMLPALRRLLKTYEDMGL